MHRVTGQVNVVIDGLARAAGIHSLNHDLGLKGDAHMMPFGDRGGF